MELFLNRGVSVAGRQMLDLFLSLAAAAGSVNPDTALALCAPELASKAGGQVDKIDIQASRVSDSWTIIRGNLIMFNGMGRPPPGAAGTHHLIRAEYDYICWVRGHRVTKTTLTQP